MTHCPYHEVMTSTDLAHFDPLGKHLEDPTAVFAYARAKQPVFFSEALGAWVITRADDVRYAASHPEVFSSQGALAPVSPLDREIGALLEKGIGFIPTEINTDPPLHARYRVPLNKLFHHQRLQQLLPVITAQARSLIDTFPDEDSIDLMTAYARPFSLLTLMTIMGLPHSHAQQISTWTEEALALTSTRFSAEQRNYHLHCAESFAYMQTYLLTVVEEKMRQPGNDLLSLLLLPEFQAQADAPLSPKEVAMIGFSLLMAGHKTSAAFIGAAGLLFLQHNVWPTIAQSPELLPNYLEEVLRFDGAVPYFFRSVTQNVELGGMLIPAGSLVLLAYASANKDENRYTDPNNFQHERFTKALQKNIPHTLAFGHGIHYCPGAQLARWEVQIALEQLF